MDELVPTANDGESKNTRDRILGAAEQLFADKGFAGTAVRDIAGKVGLNAASLYNHFPGKDDLYEAVLDRGLEPVFELLQELVQTDSPLAQEQETIDRVVLHFAGSPNLAKLIHHEALTGGERLARISGRWLGPIYGKGVEALQHGAALEHWEEDELPLLLTAFLNVIMGYFALVPLMEMMLGEDPLSEEAIARQTAFVRKIPNLLVPGEWSGA